MVMITPTNAAVRSLEGLHLYHSARSNCSARVRLLLDEKHLDWTSHALDLLKKENISEEYFGINPKGLVPALVHDGTVIIESNDILVYLDETFPETRFGVAREDDRARLDTWLQKSTDLHIPAIKTFQYFKMNAALLQKTQAEEDLYWKLQKDPDLRAFHGKHSGGKTFTSDDAAAAVELLNGVFAEIDQALVGHEWMMGDDYSLADISWGPSMTTLLSGGFDFSPFPHVERWYDALCQRPEFDKAVIQWRKQANWEKLLKKQG
ncbi:MAG: glutathione S-transferase family protein [Alphaproteobacteria bacterium]|jgi:glutathione S-transferase|nr:glutathione S-transferase family protein [Alphaproteobacteria bacterium]